MPTATNTCSWWLKKNSNLAHGGQRCVPAAVSLLLDPGHRHLGFCIVLTFWCITATSPLLLLKTMWCKKTVSLQPSRRCHMSQEAVGRIRQCEGVGLKCALVSTTKKSTRLGRDRMSRTSFFEQSYPLTRCSYYVKSVHKLGFVCV